MRLKILGPPGTGKTRKLLDILESEIKLGVKPSRVGFLTFTRAARIEALQRTGKTEADFPYIKTIHSICYHQLGIGRDQIVRPENIRQFGKQIGARLSGSDLDPWIEEFTRGIDSPTKDDFLLQANHIGRHKKILLKDALNTIPMHIDFQYAAWFTKAYRAWKTTYSLLDYTDLLQMYVDHGKPLDVDVLFVDEAQDLSKLQWEVVEILGANAARWYICGDDDQAIFNWAGANSEVFQDLPADKVDVLCQSHRISKAVHVQAMKIVNRINRRLDKTYLPRDAEGDVSNAGYIGSIDVKEKTFLLFRNHYRGSALSEIMRREMVPFIGKGSPLWNPDLRAMIMAWYLLVKKKEASVDLVKRLLMFIKKDEFTNPGLPELLKEKSILTADQVFIRPMSLVDWHSAIDYFPNKDIIASYLEKRGFLRVGQPKLELLSIHQSKGREATNVLLDPEMSKAVWMSMTTFPDDEHRVWYVAVTRAKEQVQWLIPNGPYCYKP